MATLQPDSNVSVDRFLQPEKQRLGIVSIDEGMHIDWSDEQLEKADSPRIET
jgi:hypothetical protein